MKAATLLYCLAPLALAACGPKVEGPKPAIDTAKAVDLIKTDEVHWNADWKSGDPAKVAAHYAQGATVMIPGAAPMVGQPAILAGVKGAMDDPGFSLTFASDKVDIAASGDLAATRGTYRETAQDPKTHAAATITGSYVTVYKPQADGAWKAVWDITTPSVVAGEAAK
jgi:ketosteroid isomerase-like protein